MKVVTKIFVGVAITFTAIALYTVVSIYEESQLIPSKNLKTISDFLNEMPPPQFIYALEHNDETLYELYGPVKNTIRVASGPPAYLFNAQGQLIDWSTDTGEDTVYLKKWMKFTKKQITSLTELKRMLNISEKLKHESSFQQQ